MLKHNRSQELTVQQGLRTPTISSSSGTTSPMQVKADGPSSEQLQLSSSSLLESHISKVTEEFCVEFEREDHDDPRNFSRRRKWTIAAIALLIELWGNLISAVAAPAVEQIAKDLDVSVEMTHLVQAVFLYGFALGAVIWSPLSEDYGRKPAMIASLCLLAVTQICCALARSFTLMIISRCLAGCFAAATVVSIGIISDLWASEHQSWPINTFALCGETGAMIGPVFGVLIQDKLGWRWIFWVLAASTFAILLVYIIICPETRSGIILHKKACHLRRSEGDTRYFARHDQDIRKRTWREMLTVTLFRPIFMLFREPIVLSFAIFDAFNYSIIYLALEAVPMVYQQWSFSPLQQSLAFLAMIVGCVVAFGLYYFQLCAEDKAALRNHGQKPAESRLFWMIPAGLLFPISLFWFAWTTQGPPIPWIASIFSLGLFGVSSHVIFISVSDYTIASYSIFAASAFGAQSFLRELMSGSATLFAAKMYKGLGYQWASSLLGFFAVVLSAIPFVLYRWGPRIRAASKFALEIEQAEAEAKGRNAENWRDEQTSFVARQRKLYEVEKGSVVGGSPA